VVVIVDTYYKQQVRMSYRSGTDERCCIWAW